MRTRFALALASLLSVAVCAQAQDAPAEIRVETITETTTAAAQPAGAPADGAFNCLDAAGKPVPSVNDTASPLLFRTEVKDGTARIVYNPERLTRLSQQATLFLYAQECARLNMGMAGVQQNSLEQARAADCRAINRLKAAGQVTNDEIPFIEGDLILSDAEWTDVAGPQRGFALSACQGDMPVLAQQQAASAGGNTLAMVRAGATATPEWDACVRRCAQPMLRCGGSESCLTPHLACVDRCGQ